MWNPTFLYIRRLRRDLPAWVDKGWIRPEHQDAILQDVRDGVHDKRRAPVALAVLGVILFGAGIISFFAANWAEMSKLAKLTVLLISLWGAYGTGGWMLARGRLDHRFGHAMLLLGAILFGANIMLIAQAFHISGRMPNSVLLWALGALLTTYLVPNQMTTVFGLVLTALWTLFELPRGYFSFLGTLYIPFDGPVHWPFLVVWSLFLPPVIRHRWRLAGHVATIVLLLWSALSLAVLADTHHAEVIDVLRIYLLLGSALFIVGLTMMRTRRLALFAQTLKNQGMIVSAASFYLLSLRAVHGIGGAIGHEHLDSPGGGWIAGTIIAMAVVCVLVAVNWWQVGQFQRDIHAVWGRLLLVPVLAVLAFSMAVQGFSPYAMPVYLLFNFLYLTGLIWLIFAGYRTQDRFQVNLAFIGFALGLLTLYFDTFWGLMARSYFFMGLGVLLFAGGYLMERQRRRLVGGLAHADKAGGAS